MLPQLKWKRPSSVAVPNVWLRFRGKDLDSNELVEYRIEDLSEDRIEEAINFMTDYYLAHEPHGKARDVLRTDPGYVRSWQDIWRVQLAQRMTLICCKEGSDEIIGANVLYILTREDDLLEQAESQSENTSFRELFRLFRVIYEEGKFNVWDKYGVDSYMASFGLCVSPKYRGRMIGDRLLQSR